MSTSRRSRGVLKALLTVQRAIRWKSTRKVILFFSRCIHSRKAVTDRYGEIDLAVHCCSLVVNPGDITFADGNGLLAFTAARLANAVRMALAARHKEAEIQKRVRLGAPFSKSRGSLNLCRRRS